LPLTITPNDTLRSRTYSFLCILRKRFHPYGFAALCTPSYNASKWVLKNCNSIHRKSLLPRLRVPYAWTTFLWRRRLLAFGNVLPQTSHS
jgi:hypothetical protein